MKKLFITLLSACVLLVSCNSENEDLTNNAPEISEADFVQTFHYDGIAYEIGFKENEEGEFEPITELPSILKALEDVDDLATVVSDNDIYYFDNLKAQFEYFGMDYEKLLNSRIENQKNETIRASFSPSAFNDGVRAFEHDNWTGRRLYVNSIEDMKNLTRVGFNDKMSSVAISVNYQFRPHLGDKVIFYFDSNWRGRSLSFISTQLWYVPSVMPLQFRGHNSFRKIKYGFFKTYADKISSIDVVIGGSSIVR